MRYYKMLDETGATETDYQAALAEMGVKLYGVVTDE